MTEGVHEDLVVSNHAQSEQRVRVELSFAADFADVMDAQQQGTLERGRYSAEVGKRAVTLWQERDGYRRGTVIRCQRVARLGRDRVVFDLRLGPGESWKTCIDLIPVVDGARRSPLLACGSFGRHAPKMPLSLDEWFSTAPELEADWDPARHVYRQSLLDLAALRIRPREEHLRHAMPAGGLPWYMTVFGRDSIIAAYQTLPFQAELAGDAAGARRVAGHRVGRLRRRPAREDPARAAARLAGGDRGDPARLPRHARRDRALLDPARRVRALDGDRAFVRELEQNARAALAWLEGPADLDGDGYLEYIKRSDAPSALDNHCWKDSDDSVRFADGRQAEPPIATCEIQGYAYVPESLGKLRLR